MATGSKELPSKREDIFSPMDIRKTKQIGMTQIQKFQRPISGIEHPTSAVKSRITSNPHCLYPAGDIAVSPFCSYI
jgi:hypothetical protein